MLFAGHIGISLILVNCFEGVVRFGKRNVVDRDTSFIDYRFVAVGAILPDLIDKPAVELIYGLRNHQGHFIAHTVLFCSILILIGIYFMLAKGKTGILILGVCSLLHYLQDWVILGPNENLYKIFGRLFFIVPKNFGIFEHLAQPIYQMIPYFRDVRLYFLQPYVYIFEVLGVCIIACYGIRLLRKKRLMEFIKTGKL